MRNNFCCCYFFCPILITLALLVTFKNVAAQYSVNGKVTDHTLRPLTNCNVLLLLPKDSSLMKGVVCNMEGSFILKNVTAGKYLLGFSHMGFENTYLPITLEGDKNIYDAGDIALSSIQQKLNEVTIVTKKPLFEQKIDRMIVNVKNSITSAGGSVLDVLQKSPGVIVNKQDGTIHMSGKEGVQVMINGKMNYMPASALITMLEGMPSNNVERIELITTPPAKYDAGGNAGYINIVLVQNPNQGFNGSYTVTMAAWYGTWPSANFDFNYRKKRMNFYGSLATSRKAQEQIGIFYRSVLNQYKNTETIINTKRDPSQLNFSARLGLDYKLSEKTTIGILAAGYNNKWHMNAFNNSSTVINSIKDTAIDINNEEVNHWKHGMANINLQHTTEGGGEMTINADYLYYNNYNPTDYTNSYFNGAGQFLEISNLKSSKRTIIKILPLQFDYTKKINPSVDFEAGAKAVFSKFTNDVLVAELEETIWKPDADFTGNYLLKENIGAAYASASITVNDKNSIKAGLRYEYTNSNLGSEKEKNIVDRKYGYFFPTVFWSHTINENNKISFSYNKRINRPTFNNLAPFLIFIDPNTFISGNAALQPAISDAVKIDYSYRRFIFSAGYTDEKYTIGNFQIRVDTVTNKQYMVAQNLKRTKTINGLVAMPFQPTKWWSGNINVVAVWQNAEADFSKEPVTVSVFNYNISGAQTFILPKDFSAELSGFYQSESLFGVAKFKALGQLNIGIQKKFSSSSLKFGVDDLFSTFKFRFVTDAPKENFYSTANIQISRRIFKITFSKNFGNKILKNKRERNTASESERQRVTQQ